MNFSRLKTWRKRLGNSGERIAARYLESIGMTVLVRNCKTDRAELDIVLRDGKMLVIAEVKTLYRKKGNLRELHPASHLTENQKRRIRNGARCYLAELGNPPLIFRYDLVEVVMNRFGVESLRHHPAFMNSEKTMAAVSAAAKANPVPERVFRRRNAKKEE